MSGSQEIFNKDTLINFIINLSVFVIVWRILADFIFSAFGATFERRKEMVDGQKKKAQELHLKSEEVTREYELRISAEKTTIKKIIESVIAETETTQKKHIQLAREVAASELDRARKRIAEEAEKTREELKKDIPSIAIKMASRVIGRELSL